MELLNDDCFNVFPLIEEKSVDLFVLDLPYANKKFGNCTACKWDTPIDLKKMWIEIKRIMKPNATIVHFCNTKFGFALIESNPKWFRYDLIWKKSKKVGFLSANKMPLRQHENIYVFSNEEDDTDIVRNIELREYAKKVFEYIGKSLKTINKELGHRKAEHFFYFKTSQFGLPIEKTYNELIEKYNIDNMEGFKTYEEMKDLEELTTYNPQKTEGKPYTCKRGGTGYYGELGEDYTKNALTDNKGDRHPTSIIEIEPDHENIYVFSNEEDDTDIVRNIELRAYSKKVFEYIGKSKKDIINKLGQGLDHFFRFSSSQFALPIEENYNKLIEKYNIDKMEGFKTYEEMKELEELTTYNPQKTEGKPYNCKQGKQTDLYGIEDKEKVLTKNKGDRHPTSIIETDGGVGSPHIENTILEYKNPHKTIHRTQKPVDLLEWLIKTYSNEGDTVMDFCMGSGTAGVASKNLNRKFIGVEKDEDMFQKAKARIESAN